MDELIGNLVLRWKGEATVSDSELTNLQLAAIEYLNTARKKIKDQAKGVAQDPKNDTSFFANATQIRKNR